MQKLASVKVYAIKSNCDLQVLPGILKGVHLSELTGKKILIARKQITEDFWSLVIKKPFHGRLKTGKGSKFSLLNNQYTTTRLSESLNINEFDLEVFKFIDIVFKKYRQKKLENFREM